jgi:hypothetical protein
MSEGTTTIELSSPQEGGSFEALLEVRNILARALHKIRRLVVGQTFNSRLPESPINPKIEEGKHADQCE